MVKTTPHQSQNSQSRTVHRTLLHALAIAMCVGSVLLMTAGCGPGRNHKKAVNSANDRWRTMRSGMFLQMAQQRFDTGDLDESRNQLMEAFSVDPQNAELFILSGRIALEKGQLERAMTRFDKAIEFDPDLSMAYYYRGVVLQRWTKFELAYQSYSKAFLIEGDNVAYLMAMSEMLVALDTPDKALELLVENATFFDQHASLRTAIGRLYAMNGRVDESLAYFREAALLRPDDLQAQEELAAAYLQAGQFEDAVDRLEFLVADKQTAERIELKSHLAMAYMRLGRLDKAKKTYRTILRAEPDRTEDWIRLGQVMWGLKDLSGAMEAASRTISVSPRRFEGYLLGGMVWQKRGSAKRALAMFDEAAKLAPDAAMPMILKGLTLEHAGRPEAAAVAYAEALRRQPGDHRAERLLTAVETSLGD